MGGDDLGSDDEYLAAPIRATVVNLESNSEERHDHDDHKTGRGTISQKGNTRKRQNPTASVNISGPNTNYTEDSVADDQVRPSKKQKSPKKQRGGPLKALGHGIRDESVESKAELLSHFTGSTSDTDGVSDAASVVFLPQQVARVLDKSSSPAMLHSNDILDRLLCYVSKKQLKKPRVGKNIQSSPRIVILCLSARRAVSILKELAPLRMRIAKLFPKQGTCQEQAQQLATNDYAVAVGTPQRLEDLLHQGALSLAATQLVMLDTFQNGKNFSVYTLPDTAPFCVNVLKDYVHPACCCHGKQNTDQEVKVGFL